MQWNTLYHSHTVEESRPVTWSCAGRAVTNPSLLHLDHLILPIPVGYVFLAPSIIPDFPLTEVSFAALRQVPSK